MATATSRTKSKSNETRPRPTPVRSRRYPEAPDRGEWDREAPEFRHAEAPDAGEGRMGILEHEFTHGRSQS